MEIFTNINTYLTIGLIILFLFLFKFIHNKKRKEIDSIEDENIPESEYAADSEGYIDLDDE